MRTYLYVYEHKCMCIPNVFKRMYKRSKLWIERLADSLADHPFWRFCIPTNSIFPSNIHVCWIISNKRTKDYDNNQNNKNNSKKREVQRHHCCYYMTVDTVIPICILKRFIRLALKEIIANYLRMQKRLCVSIEFAISEECTKPHHST